MPGPRIDCPVNMKKLSGAPYRAENNIWLTEALFYNRASLKPRSLWTYEPAFDLFDDRPGMVNCRTTFVNMRDPTGRKWALTYLGDWNHWLRLMKCAWFREAYDIWITELNTQLRSEAIQVAYDIMKGENGAQALAAAKFLTSEEYNKQATRGRPSKAELEGKLKEAAKAISIEDDDLKRIGLTVIDGGKVGNGS